MDDVAVTVHRKKEFSSPVVVDEKEWIELRKQLLEEEKALMKHKDAVTALRQSLPAYALGKEYMFEDSEDGASLSLQELFGSQEDLGVYHMMSNPPDFDACSICSQWVSGFNGVLPQIEKRMAFVVVAKAPWEKLKALKAANGWKFRFVSSFSSDFNIDMGVEQQRDHNQYNFGSGWWPMEQKPGLSVFRKEEAKILRTYAVFARGLESFEVTLNLFDCLHDGRME